MHRALILKVLVGLPLCAAVAGCPRGANKIAASDVPVVPVAHPVQRLVADYVDYTGRTNAKETVSIQPRVTGFLVKMPFREGAYVKKGDLLFEIDPRPYQALQEAATAAVAQNEASVRYAVATNKRFKEAAKKQAGAVSERELDQYQALEEQAIANLKLANANLESAKLNLEWTKVKSPINGRISRYFLTVGNLVNQDVTQLTTVVSMDPMYVYFDMDEPTYLRVNQALSTGGITTSKTSNEPRAGPVAGALGLLGITSGPGLLLGITSYQTALAIPDVPIMMGLEGEEGYRNRGVINFVDNKVDPSTGSMLVRGQFHNPIRDDGSRLLVPGMFVRVRLPIGQAQPKLLVIDRAITSDQGVKYVFVIDGDNEVKQRKVTTGALQEDGLRVITSGLEANDWVVIGALQQVRQRMVVQQEQMTMPSLVNPAGKVAPGATKGKK